MIYTSIEEAISKIQSNNRVFVHGGAATPNTLLKELVHQASRLKNVELMHMHTEGPAEYTNEKYKENFRVVNLFVGANMRAKLDYDRIDYLPCFLSEMPALFRSGRRPIDVALIHVSEPDAQGFVSLGVSVDVALAACQTAKMIIAQVNPKMPRTHGDGFIHISKINCLVRVEEDLWEPKRQPLNEIEIKIGKYAAGLVDDGATLQAGIGNIPDAVLASLKNHRNLGIHTEMWSDGALDLIECGAVDNSQKLVHVGKTVSGFLMGSRKLYDYVDDNPSVVQLDITYVNFPVVIARNPKVTAINSAVEIDLTGQVCADSIGHKIISGVGGQMDFMRGAAISKGGKPIIAMTSRTHNKKSRLVTELNAGAGVVTTRSHVHYVVTEYGIADLYGKTLHERAKALIEISHPDDREQLERGWHEIYHNKLATKE